MQRQSLQRGQMIDSLQEKAGPWIDPVGGGGGGGVFSFEKSVSDDFESSPESVREFDLDSADDGTGCAGFRMRSGVAGTST